MLRVKTIVCGAVGIFLLGTVSAKAEDVYVVHGIPLDDAPATELVDVEVVELAACVPNIAFGAIQDPVDLPPGTYTVNVRVADGACGGPIALPTVINVKNAALVASQAVVVHLTASGSPTITVFDNLITKVAPSTKSRVFLHHTARAPLVDVLVRNSDTNTSRLVRNVANGDQGNLRLDAGSYSVRVRPAGKNTSVLSVPLDASGDTAYLLYVVGSLRKETLTALAIVVPE